MEALVLNVELLPIQLREKISSQKVSVLERDGGIVLMPVQEGSGLRGIAASDKLTIERFLSYRTEDGSNKEKSNDNN